MVAKPASISGFIAQLCAGLMVLGGGAQTAAALDLTFAHAHVRTANQTDDLAQVQFLTGPWVWPKGARQLLATGQLRQRAYRISAPDLQPLAILGPLRDQIIKAGYQIGFECGAAQCGGFDFRFALPLLSEPQMHVDLGRYQYIFAQNQQGHLLMLIVSASSDAGYVQLNELGPQGLPPLQNAARPAKVKAPSPAMPHSPSTRTMAQHLARAGFAVLEDVRFTPNSAELAADAPAGLAALGEYLAQDPTRAVIIVGHTDSSGELASNMALSKARAQSVAAWLARQPGIGPSQVTAEGVGPLAPRDSNATPLGRIKNRRVEVLSAPAQLR